MTVPPNEMPTTCGKTVSLTTVCCEGKGKELLRGTQSAFFHTHLLRAQQTTVSKCLEYCIKAVCPTSQSY